MRGVNWAVRHECNWLETCKIRILSCETFKLRGPLLQITQWSMHARQGMEIITQLHLMKYCKEYVTSNVSIEYIYSISATRSYPILHEHSPVWQLTVVDISGCFMFQFYLRSSVRNYKTENFILVCQNFSFSDPRILFGFPILRDFTPRLPSLIAFCSSRDVTKSKPYQQHRPTEQPWASFSCSLPLWRSWYRSHRTRRMQS